MMKKSESRPAIKITCQSMFVSSYYLKNLFTESKNINPTHTQNRAILLSYQTEKMRLNLSIFFYQRRTSNFRESHL